MRHSLATLDPKVRSGLLWLAATSGALTLLVWAFVQLMMEAVALPELQAVLSVSLICGLALPAFVALMYPLGVAVKLLVEGEIATRRAYYGDYGGRVTAG